MYVSHVEIINAEFSGKLGKRLQLDLLLWLLENKHFDIGTP